MRRTFIAITAAFALTGLAACEQEAEVEGIEEEGIAEEGVLTGEETAIGEGEGVLGEGVAEEEGVVGEEALETEVGE